jgi:hypothetical protein
VIHEYDFEAVKRAYAEMARRALEKDEVRRPYRSTAPTMESAEPAGDAGTQPQSA